MEKALNTKKWGIGSLTVPFSLFAILFSFSSIGGKEIGRYFFEFIGIPFPHVIISTIFLIVAVILGFKHKDDYLAKCGSILALFMLVMESICIIGTSLASCGII